MHGNADAHKVDEFLLVAEDILRRILRWYLVAIETHDNPREILKKLDESLVEGGSIWADSLLTGLTLREDR